MHNRKSGFTLTELLIVVAILGIVLSMAIVGYSRVFGKVSVEKTQQRAEQVALFIKQLEVLNVPPTEMVARINRNKDFADYTLAEKVVGSYEYMKDTLATGTSVCDSSKPLYMFLNALDGSASTPVVGVVISNVANTASTVHCAHGSANNFSVSVRVDDDNNWWCGSGHPYFEGSRYFSTVESGQVRVACRYRDEATIAGSGCGSGNRFCKANLFKSLLSE